MKKSKTDQKLEAKVAPEIIADEQSLATTQEQRQYMPGGITGKGFQPGQSGNPNGRPKDELKALGLRIAQLKAGKILSKKELQYIKDLGLESADINVITYMMTQLATSRDPAKIAIFLERVYGKVPNINLNAQISENIVQRFKSKFTDAELERIGAGEDAMEILLEKLPDVDNVPDYNVVDAEVEDE